MRQPNTKEILMFKLVEMAHDEKGGYMDLAMTYAVPQSGNPVLMVGMSIDGEEHVAAAYELDLDTMTWRDDRGKTHQRFDRAFAETFGDGDETEESDEDVAFACDMAQRLVARGIGAQRARAIDTTCEEIADPSRLAAQDDPRGERDR